MSAKDAALGPSDARQIAYEFREKFRNAEAFEAAWNRLFELRTAVTPALARRFLGEDLLKYRAHLAGLEAADFLAPQPDAATPPRPDAPFTCPGCQRTMGEWQRDGHATSCAHVGCYALEVKCRIAIERRQAARKRRLEEERRTPPEAPPVPATTEAGVA